MSLKMSILSVDKTSTEWPALWKQCVPAPATHPVTQVQATLLGLSLRKSDYAVIVIIFVDNDIKETNPICEFTLQPFAVTNKKDSDHVFKDVCYDCYCGQKSNCFYMCK